MNVEVAENHHATTLLGAKAPLRRLNPRADARNKVKHDEYFSMHKYYKYFFFNNHIRATDGFLIII